jgi:hypothetical protein
MKMATVTIDGQDGLKIGGERASRRSLRQLKAYFAVLCARSKRDVSI